MLPSLCQALEGQLIAEAVKGIGAQEKKDERPRKKSAEMGPVGHAGLDVDEQHIQGNGNLFQEKKEDDPVGAEREAGKAKAPEEQHFDLSTGK